MCAFWTLDFKESPWNSSRNRCISQEIFLSWKSTIRNNAPHILGGALILSKKIFYVLPFDPYVAGGEDHAYALDLKWVLDKNEIVVRDNHFIVGHRRETSQKHTDMNVLRDIFRFLYSHAKTRRSFITLLTVRWSFTSLISLFLNPSNYKQYKNELWTLLFVAPRFLKENASKFRRSIKAWSSFLHQLRS